MRGRVRVLLVDDDDLMRAGLRAVLSSDASLEVIGEAIDGGDAVARAARLKRDIALMDIRMPRVDGIAATREILAHAPEVRILVVTTFEDDEYIFGALNAGAPGFCSSPHRPKSSSQRSAPWPPERLCCRRRSPAASSTAWPGGQTSAPPTRSACRS